jgi:hypothetical protein
MGILETIRNDFVIRETKSQIECGKIVISLETFAKKFGQNSTARLIKK